MLAEGDLIARERRSRLSFVSAEDSAAGAQALSAAVVAFALVAAILFFQFVNNVGPMEPYKFLHWLWSYDLGFTKRGLVGTILEIFSNENGDIYTEVVSASEMLLLVTYLSYAAFAAAIVWRQPTLPVFCVALSGAILQPALPALSFDFGRLDQVNLTLLFMCCLAVVFGGRRLAGFAVAAASGIAILVHEAFLIMHLPLCAALLAVRLRTVDELPVHRIVRTIGLVLIVPAVAFGAVWFAGVPVPKDVWVEYWTRKAGFSNDLTLYALNVHYLGIRDSIKATLAEFSIVRAFFGVAVIVSATVIAIFAWRRILPQRLWWEKAACFAAAMSPVLMFALGIDYLRWSSMLVTNLLVATLVLLGLGSMARAAMQGSPQRISKRPYTFWPVLLPGLCYVFLAFPQSTGVANYRIPNEIRCEHLNRWFPLLRDKVFGAGGCDFTWTHLHQTTAR